MKQNTFGTFSSVGALTDNNKHPNAMYEEKKMKEKGKTDNDDMLKQNSEDEDCPCSDPAAPSKQDKEGGKVSPKLVEEDDDQLDDEESEEIRGLG